MIPIRRKNTRSTTRDGLLGFGYAVGASAQGPKVIGGVERLMPVDPCDEHPALAEARKLAQPLTRFGNRSGDLALAQVTGARAPQIFQRKNTVVAIVPHDANRIAADFMQRFDNRSL